MFEVFEFMRSHGRRPGPETCYILVKGCVDHGRPDLAEVRAGPAPWAAGAACSGLPRRGGRRAGAGARSVPPAAACVVSSNKLRWRTKTKPGWPERADPPPLKRRCERAKRSALCSANLGPPSLRCPHPPTPCHS